MAITPMLSHFITPASRSLSFYKKCLVAEGAAVVVVVQQMEQKCGIFFFCISPWHGYFSLEGRWSCFCFCLCCCYRHFKKTFLKNVQEWEGRDNQTVKDAVVHTKSQKWIARTGWGRRKFQFDCPLLRQSELNSAVVNRVTRLGHLLLFGWLFEILWRFDFWPKEVKNIWWLFDRWVEWILTMIK